MEDLTQTVNNSWIMTTWRLCIGADYDTKMINVSIFLKEISQKADESLKRKETMLF